MSQCYALLRSRHVLWLCVSARMKAIFAKITMNLPSRVLCLQTTDHRNEVEFLEFVFVIFH